MRYKIVEYLDNTCEIKYKYRWWPFWFYVVDEYWKCTWRIRYKDKEEAKAWINAEIARLGAYKIHSTKKSVEEYP